MYIYIYHIYISYIYNIYIYISNMYIYISIYIQSPYIGLYCSYIFFITTPCNWIPKHQPKSANLGLIAYVHSFIHSGRLPTHSLSSCCSIAWCIYIIYILQYIHVLKTVHTQIHIIQLCFVMHIYIQQTAIAVAKEQQLKKQQFLDSTMGLSGNRHGVKCGKTMAPLDGMG